MVSADDFESGTIAAAFGGTTTIVDFAIQTKGESTMKGLDVWHEKAAGRATIDYGFHMIITDMAVERLPDPAALTALLATLAETLSVIIAIAP